MRMYDLILKKKLGLELSDDEINYFIENYTKGIIPDYQASALLMAIYFKKMTREETTALTMAMVNSGDVLDLSLIDGIKVDKHSTGGVGDKVSLVLTPMVASLGIPVAKMSGRGLGHTGGTIDKLESFKGFSVNLSKEEFISNVNKHNIAIAGQTGDLAPADKKLYGLRDVTATVDNISLIASSIMSKKIASGADSIVLDVKVGDGAFMKDEKSAIELAEEMVYIGNKLNRKTVAIISDMDQPLGFAVGNILEVKEAIDTLKGKGPKDLLELCLTLGSQMVILANKAESVFKARGLLLETIENGKAIEKLKELINVQGGDIAPIDDFKAFEKASYILEVKAKNQGYISKIHTEKIGIIAMELGSGRATKESIIDLSVGIVLNKKRGDKVVKEEVIAYVHGNSKEKAEKAVLDIMEAYEISESYKGEIPLIYRIIS